MTLSHIHPYIYIYIYIYILVFTFFSHFADTFIQSCGEESDVWSGLDLCSAVAVAEAVLLALGQAGRPLQPGPSSSMGGSKSDKEAQFLRVCVCVCVCVCVRVVL